MKRLIVDLSALARVLEQAECKDIPTVISSYAECVFKTLDTALVPRTLRMTVSTYRVNYHADRSLLEQYVPNAEIRYGVHQHLCQLIVSELLSTIFKLGLQSPEPIYDEDKKQTRYFQYEIESVSDTGTLIVLVADAASTANPEETDTEVPVYATPTTKLS